MKLKLIILSLIFVISGCASSDLSVKRNHVRFVSEGKTYARVNVEHGSSISVRRFPSDPIRQGYAFAGWSLETEDRAPSFNSDSAVFDEEITVYAIWTKAIFSATDLELIRLDPSGSYTLTDNITLFDGEWEPIGTSEEPFTGVLDGAGHRIKGLSINAQNEFSGMFGVISGAEIRNLRVDGKVISTAPFAGILTGIADKSAIINCTVTGEVVGSMHAGGIAGEIRQSSLSGVVSAASVYADKQEAVAGGIAGLISDSAANISKSSGKVFSGGTSGGIAGIAQNSTLRSVYATGEIEAALMAGGVAGNMLASSVTAAYSTGEVKVGSSGYYAGGIAGNADSSSRIESSLAAGAGVYGTRTARISPASGVTLLYNYGYSGTEIQRDIISRMDSADGENTSLNVNKNFYSGADRVNMLKWDFKTVWRMPGPDEGKLPVFIKR